MNRNAVKRPKHPPAAIGNREVPEEQAAFVVELPPGKRFVDMPRVTVGDTPQRILVKGSGRYSVRIFNDGSKGAAFGGPQLKRTTGTKIPPGIGWNEKDAPDAEIWACCTNAGDETTLRIQIVAIDRES
ncbi:MAG: hypothetical protein K0S46_2202 [Moraxellaceae bacterium]|jgi:hypothetical protein|nr:hypothetical protein [Moraxellaceae bacterium]